jgi:hypothetical protein
MEKIYVKTTVRIDGKKENEKAPNNAIAMDIY